MRTFGLLVQKGKGRSTYYEPGPEMVNGLEGLSPSLGGLPPSLGGLPPSLGGLSSDLVDNDKNLVYKGVSLVHKNLSLVDRKMLMSVTKAAQRRAPVRLGLIRVCRARHQEPGRRLDMLETGMQRDKYLQELIQADALLEYAIAYNDVQVVEQMGVVLLSNGLRSCQYECLVPSFVNHELMAWSA